ncbi:MAG TPA: ankyrin repeat domain-containing protein [Patescibacteria group bacterium]|nr:ankyrin repeat domain-containing protein [Patescibacteria group bacterium]
MAFISTKKTFFKAASSGDMKELRYCLESLGYDINSKNGDGNTVTHLAAAAGQLEILQYLIARKPDLAARNKDGSAPLLSALTENKSKAALLLIAASADVNDHNDAYAYPIHWAAHHGDLDVVAALAEKGADLDARTGKEERTASYFAAASDRGRVFEYLLAQGARIDIPDTSGATAESVAREKYPRLAAMIDAAKKPVAAAVTAPPANENKPASNETWTLMSDTTIAKVAEMPVLNRKITEIFNFESRERLIISENLKTGAETLGAAEPFAAIAENILARAADEMRKAGGTVPVMDDRPSNAAGKLKI